MAFLFLKIKRFLVFFILKSVLKNIKPSKNVDKNSDLLNLSRDIYGKIMDIDKELSKKQDEIILFSVNFDGALDFSNVFIDRLNNDVKRRIRTAGKNEYLVMDFERKDENFKST